MRALILHVQYHWGFWVRTPATSKFQSSLSIPPPTTIIGSITYPLIKRGSLTITDKKKKVKEKVKGEVMLDSKGFPMSPAAILENHMTATARFNTGSNDGKQPVPYVWEDINKYNTILFQEKTMATEEEKLVHGRRYLMKYRFGAVSTGKVYYPSGELTAILLVSDSISEVISGNVDEELKLAAWEITRMGSKESIVSVKDVKVVKAEPIDDKKVNTSCYFLAELGTVENGQSYYRETFWRGGWGRNSKPLFEEYIVPGKKAPLSSTPVTVYLSEDAQAFRVDDEIVITRWSA